MVVKTSFAQKIEVVTEDFPPYNYMHDGKVTGFSTEVLQAVAKQTGFELSIKIYPWARAYRMALNKKNILIYSLAKTPSRESLFQWVGEITPAKSCLFSLKHREDIKISQLSDAQAFRVVTQRAGRIEKKLLQEGFSTSQNLMPTSSSTSALKMLLSERADLWAFPEFVVKYVAEEQGYQPNELLQKLYCFEKTELQMAFSLQTPVATVDKFRAALIKVKKAKSYQAILNKYSVQ